MQTPKKYIELYDAIKEYPHAQAEMLKKAFLYAFFAQLEGDYLEFGVYRGENISTAYHFAQLANPAIFQDNPGSSMENKLLQMNFYAFDSFEGLPPLKDNDLEGYVQPDFAAGAYCFPAKDFKENLKANGVDLSKVKIVEGFYDSVLNEKTKNKLPLKKAALVYIDCDLYSSTVPVLDFIKDYLVDGSVLMFDDWFSYRGNPNKGEQKAFWQWLKKNPEIKVSQFHKFSWHGNSFIVHK